MQSTTVRTQSEHLVLSCGCPCGKNNKEFGQSCWWDFTTSATAGCTCEWPSQRHENCATSFFSFSQLKMGRDEQGNSSSRTKIHTNAHELTEEQTRTQAHSVSFSFFIQLPKIDLTSSLGSRQQRWASEDPVSLPRGLNIRFKKLWTSHWSLFVSASAW